MLRSVLIILLAALFFFIVAFGVLMGGYALAHAMQDGVGAAVLMWIARSCLMLMVADLILLVSVLGVNALIREESGRQDAERARKDGRQAGRQAD